jgi:hypothetical protein
MTYYNDKFKLQPIHISKIKNEKVVWPQIIELPSLIAP